MCGVWVPQRGAATLKGGRMSKRRQKSGHGVPVGTAAAAADRFFRAYYRHSMVPDEDTLFDLLNALHNLNDKLGRFAGNGLHGSASFTVLRKLRKKKPYVTEQMIGTVRWYGSVADIQPYVFNVAVDVYEKIEPLRLGLDSEAYTAFRDLYEEEAQDGRRHHVDGEIACWAGDIDQVLERLFRQTPRALGA